MHSDRIQLQSSVNRCTCSFELSLNSRGRAMQFTKITVVVLILVASTCRGKIIIPTPSRDETTPTLVEDLAEVVASCYGPRIEVGIIGDVHDDLARVLSTQHFIPVVLIDSFRSHTFIRRPLFHHKLHVFIADVNSVRHFNYIIQERLKYSIWWNNMATLFILDRTRGCEESTKYMLDAWHDDFVNVNILCDDSEDGRVIITYNPFTSKAPTPWLPIHVVTGSRNHPFTMFKRHYRRNGTTCVNMDFDKTKDFGGYPAIVVGGPLGYEVRWFQSPGNKHDWRTTDRIFYTLSRNLNISLYFADGHSNYDIMKDAYVVEIDVHTTYPYKECGVVIISQFRGHKSQLNKIFSIIDVDSRIGLGMVYLITLMFLKLFVRQALVPAFLNLVRITCDSGFQNLTDNTASRIYMTSLLFFVVTMQGIFQGKLAALLTQQVPVQQVNTMQDVVKFGYKIYGHGAHENLIDYLKVRERFTMVYDPENCIAHVVNDSLVACIWVDMGVIFDAARESNLHISNKFIDRTNIAVPTRRNWPLHRRVDMIIKRMVEADIVDSWYDKCNPTKLSDFQIDVEVQKNKDFKNIELSELTFAFVILGIGLVCATITFFAEMAIQYKCILIDRQNLS